MSYILNKKQEKNLLHYLKKNVAWICPDLDLVWEDFCSHFCTAFTGILNSPSKIPILRKWRGAPPSTPFLKKRRTNRL